MDSEKSAFQWRLIASWNGNDSRFWHRDGGQPHERIYWVDRFQGFEPTICGIARERDLLTLDPGSYKIVWACEYIFRAPACRRPGRNAALQLTVRGLHGSSGGQRLDISHFLDESYVCRHKNGLIYSGGIQKTFTLNQRTDHIDCEIQGWKDADYDPDHRGDTNAREIIVYKMKLYKQR